MSTHPSLRISFLLHFWAKVNRSRHWPMSKPISWAANKRSWGTCTGTQGCSGCHWFSLKFTLVFASPNFSGLRCWPGSGWMKFLMPCLMLDQANFKKCCCSETIFSLSPDVSISPVCQKIRAGTMLKWIKVQLTWFSLIRASLSFAKKFIILTEKKSPFLESVLRFGNFLFDGTSKAHPHCLALPAIVKWWEWDWSRPWFNTKFAQITPADMSLPHWCATPSADPPPHTHWHATPNAATRQGMSWNWTNGQPIGTINCSTLHGWCIGCNCSDLFMFLWRLNQTHTKWMQLLHHECYDRWWLSGWQICFNHCGAQKFIVDFLNFVSTFHLMNESFVWFSRKRTSLQWSYSSM